jgi:hypothetical protein
MTAMKRKSKQIIIQAHIDKVFAYMDNIGNTGMHMMKSSMPMMGGKLELQQLSANNTGPNVKFRWLGKVMGFRMDFTVVVTKWIQNEEKVWETVGEARMIILSWYRMDLHLTATDDSTKVELGIDYEIPKNLFFRILGFFLAPWYASWCLNNMLHDSKTELEIK